MSECTELTITTDLLEMLVANGENTTLSAAPLAMSVAKVENEIEATQDELEQMVDCVDELPGGYSNGYSAGHTTGTGP